MRINFKAISIKATVSSNDEKGLKKYQDKAEAEGIDSLNKGLIKDYYVFSHEHVVDDAEKTSVVYLTNEDATPLVNARKTISNLAQRPMFSASPNEEMILVPDLLKRTQDEISKLEEEAYSKALAAEAAKNSDKSS